MPARGSLPPRQLRNTNTPEKLTRKMFAAAQAAQKEWNAGIARLGKFAAAQAAQKIETMGSAVQGLFAAAQAAQKAGHTRGGRVHRFAAAQAAQKVMSMLLSFM